MHPNQHDPARRRQAIADEYDEPFEQVVIGFRQQGCNWRTIAGALEVPFDTFRKWIRELGLGDGKKNIEHVWIKPLDLKAKSLGYRGVTDMIVDYNTSGKTRNELAKALGCNKLSLYPYVPEEVKMNPVRTQKQVDARRKNVGIINARRHDNSGL